MQEPGTGKPIQYGVVSDKRNGTVANAMSKERGCQTHNLP